MTTKTRWLVGIAVVAAVIVSFAGLGIAGSRGTSPVAGTMMTGTTAGAGMMDGTWGGMTQSGPMTGGSMGAGTDTMMSGVDMEAMHERLRWS